MVFKDVLFIQMYTPLQCSNRFCELYAYQHQNTFGTLIFMTINTKPPHHKKSAYIQAHSVKAKQMLQQTQKNLSIEQVGSFIEKLPMYATGNTEIQTGSN